MKTIATIAVVGLCAIGCGASEDITTEPIRAPDATNTTSTTQKSPGVEQSGTRLRLKYRVGDDGSAVLDGVYDSDLKADCVFRVASDGVTRCVPVAVLPVAYYTDTACTVAIAPAASDCAAPAFAALDVPAAACAPGFVRLFTVGDKHTAVTLFAKAGATCAETSVPKGYDFYLVGKEVEPKVFVGSTVAIE